MVGNRFAQVERKEDALVHVREEGRPRGSLDHGAEQVPAIARVEVARSRLEQERVVAEDLEPRADGREGAHAVVLGAAVVPDACHVTADLPDGDRPALGGERRNVALHRAVQGKLPFIDQDA
jgi:hypothetical protein